MTSSDLRQKFLDFFKTRGHAVVPSSPLLPDDPSVLLTTAGMQQFKPYYIGAADPLKSPHPTLNGKSIGSRNAASAQKCFRTSDIDEVGDTSHLTFFEMLGNFSFGGYFKKDAIAWAHEFIVKELGLPISYVTIFQGSASVPKDEESRAIWNSLGVTDVREESMEDVFWGPTGKEGPCGPTTEIYCRDVNGKDIEIWNIVFNEFYFPGSREELLAQQNVVADLQSALDKERKLKLAATKQLVKLKTPGVDTGMGLERLVMIVQNVPTIFDTDLFKSFLETLIHQIPEIQEKQLRSLRIIADHARGATFLLADGVRPLNIEQGYILRRVIRRAIRHGALLNLPKGFLVQLVSKVIDLYGGTYPELIRERNNILTALADEQAKFERTVDRGLKEFGKIVERCQALGSPVPGNEISGIDAFHLYDTYGFPLELTKELAAERGFTVDEPGYLAAFALHQKKSRAGVAQKFGGHGLVLDAGEIKAATADDVQKVTRLHTATHLLHQALRQVLGLHVKQMGSDITAERLRFDFTHPQKLSELEIKQISELVNEKIKEDLPVISQEMSYDEAVAQGALAFFKEKYLPSVKIYSVGDFSKEICGGPHVTHTAKIGQFRIFKEESCAAGVRRIRATVE